VSQPARPRGRPRSITDSGRRDQPKVLTPLHRARISR
jgi:hypothetical protein